jgi:hypothetical protein
MGHPMTRRLPDLILIVLLVIGVVWVGITGIERSRLQAEFDHLAQMTGDLPIGDPSMVHLRALPTGEPLHFAWRVYLPAGYRFTRRTYSRSSVPSNVGYSNMTASVEFIARVRFLEEDGVLQVYDSFNGSRSRNSIAYNALAKLLRGRWDRLVVEQVGINGVDAIEPDDVAVLLRIKIPEEMEQEARQALGIAPEAPFDPELFRLEIGEPSPKPKIQPKPKAATSSAGK